MKLFINDFLKIRACEKSNTCYQRNGLFLKFRASEICTNEIRASKGPPVYVWTVLLISLFDFIEIT